MGTIAHARFALFQLLQRIENKSNVHEQLKFYQNIPRQHFAIIKVDSEIIANQLEKFASSISILYHLGLFPIIIHGANFQIDKILKEKKQTPEYLDDIRITDAKTLSIVRNCYLEENMKIVNELKKFEVRARPITAGVFEAEYLNFEKFQFVGKIDKVNSYEIEQSLNNGSIPVLTSLGTGPEGQIVNINSDFAVIELSRKFQPLKVMLVNEKGGFIDDETGENVSLINLNDEFNELLNGDELHYNTKLKLKVLKDIVDFLPNDSDVRIVKNEQFIKGIFNNQGSIGTTIRKGYNIMKYQSVTQFSDMNELRGILMKDKNIKEKYKNATAYLNMLEANNNNFIAYSDTNHHVFAVVMKEDIPRIQTIICNKQSMVSGLADHMFNCIIQDFPTIQWCVNTTDNVDLKWHYLKCEGSYVKNKKTLFWRGVNELPKVSNLIKTFQEKS